MAAEFEFAEAVALLCFALTLVAKALKVRKDPAGSLSMSVVAEERSPLAEEMQLSVAERIVAALAA